jgi:cholesterol transport system auxiliary component
MALQYTTKSIAACATFYWAKGLFRYLNMASVAASGLAFALLGAAGCATPQAPVAKAVYDFGAPLAVVQATPSASPLPAITLAEVEASSALDSTSLVYRLAYADAQQLRPYALARWSMPPAQLVRLRLRDALSARGPVLGSGDGAAAWVLRVELDEFSQVFDSPSASSGRVRLRATLLRGNQWAGQRSLEASALAPSADASGGVRALTTATDDAVQKLAAWVAQQMK